MAQLKGIDVSKWQGNINWRKVVNTGTVNFAIIRAGYRGYGDGTLKVDPFFHANMKGAAEHNLPTGVYFFSQAKNAAEGEEEARFVIDLLKGYKPLYPVYFDSEYSNESMDGRADKISKAARTAAADAFCQTLEKAGYYAGVYTYTSFALEGKIDYAALSKKYTMWLADYRTNYDKTLRRDMHQYSSTGIVDGITGGVDMNTCTVDFPAVIKANGLNGWRADKTDAQGDKAPKEETVPKKELDALQTKFDALQTKHKALVAAVKDAAAKYGQ